MSSAESPSGGGPLNLGDFAPPADPMPFPIVFESGVQLTTPVIVTGLVSAISNGGTGPYTISYGHTFAGAPVVEANGFDPVVALVHGLPGVSSFQLVTSAAFSSGTQLAFSFIAIGQ